MVSHLDEERKRKIEEVHICLTIPLELGRRKILFEAMA